jgi:hypothetical protein
MQAAHVFKQEKERKKERQKRVSVLLAVLSRGAAGDAYSRLATFFGRCQFSGISITLLVMCPLGLYEEKLLKYLLLSCFFSCAPS